jgi:hypothetical protein
LTCPAWENAFSINIHDLICLGSPEGATSSTNISVIAMKCRTHSFTVTQPSVYCTARSNSGELKRASENIKIFDLVNRLALSSFALPTAPQTPRTPVQTATLIFSRGLRLTHRSQLIAYVGRRVRRERLENSGAPVGFSGRAALRKKQCDLIPDGRNSAARTDGRC